MGKLPQKIYEPGELDRVRKNIGKISREEAKKMANLLGGEVGLEKERSASEKKKQSSRQRALQELEKKEQEKKRYAKIILKEKKKQEELKRQKKKRDKLAAKAKKKEKPDFVNRVKVDFLCNNKEFRMKGVEDVIAALFSGFLNIPDVINQKFIKKANENYYDALKDFITAVKILYTKSKPDIYKEISKKEFHARILTVIKKWDIDGIGIETGKLKKLIRKQPVKRYEPLVRKIYTPLIVFSNLDPDTHIRDAVKWAYSVNYELAGDNQLLKERLTRIFHEADKNIFGVFEKMKRLFYPLLMKLMESPFCSYENFFIQQMPQIISFLKINPKEIFVIEAPAAKPKVEPENKKKEQVKKEDEVEEDQLDELTPVKQVKEEKEDEEEKEKKKAQKLEAQFFGDELKKGIKFLEMLFPHSGFTKVDKYPDFYAYFQPIFGFPSGFELVARYDPLHQLIMLLAILNDMLYGFRHIKFGFLRTGRLEPQTVQQQVDDILQSWPFFIDEIISKTYISRLQDYCREIEKDTNFKKSEIARKMVNEMYSIKRMYFFPYLSSKHSIQLPGVGRKKVPRLFNTVVEFKRVLLGIVRELKGLLKTRESKGIKNIKDLKSESVLNPWDKFIYDLENPVSRRLNKVLVNKQIDSQGKTRMIDKRNNANLIFYTFSLLCMLDAFLNNRNSHFYRTPTDQIFRSVDDRGEMPQYSLKFVDGRNDVKNEADTATDGMPSTKIDTEGLLRKFFQEDAILPQLKKVISEHSGMNQAFTCMYVRTGGIAESETGLIGLGYVVHYILENVKQMPYIPIRYEDNTLLLILPKSTLNTAFNMGTKVNSQVIKKSKVSLFLGMFQYQNKWGPEKCRIILSKLIEAIKKQTRSQIIYLDHANGVFKSRKLTR
ncbi:MAG: hypothetical protein JW969_16710 [Spirochaetales bacterium]|nr:hypothetical protein [Spirochaetales bacterium]